VLKFKYKTEFFKTVAWKISAQKYLKLEANKKFMHWIMFDADDLQTLNLGEFGAF
jgi:hypothetical protein